MTAAEAEYERRRAIAARHPDEPCYRDWVAAVDPRHNDPAWVDFVEPDVDSDPFGRRADEAAAVWENNWLRAKGWAS